LHNCAKFKSDDCARDTLARRILYSGILMCHVISVLRRSSVKIVKWLASASHPQNPGLWLAALTLHKYTRAERGIGLFWGKLLLRSVYVGPGQKYGDYRASDAEGPL
jgi:hypothetical protein